jgi:hypothetical protein
MFKRKYNLLLDWFVFSFQNPYNIGCGLGGGSWKIINSIIEEVFSVSGINLSIYKYEPKNK